MPSNSTKSDLERVAVELREEDEMSYSEIAVRLPRDRAWVEEVLADVE